MGVPPMMSHTRAVLSLPTVTAMSSCHTPGFLGVRRSSCWGRHDNARWRNASLSLASANARTSIRSRPTSPIR